MHVNAAPSHARSYSRLLRLAAAWLLCVCATAAQAQGSAAPYVPTPWPILDEMLKLAEIKKGEYLIDLGSGDGRLVIEAAKRYGAQGHGIDIQEKLVKLATDNAAKASVSDRVKFIVGDLFETDLSKADVITVYLLPVSNEKVRPLLEKQLKKGARIVAHDFTVGGWTPEKEVSIDDDGEGRSHTLYLYRRP